MQKYRKRERDRQTENTHTHTQTLYFHVSLLRACLFVATIWSWIKDVHRKRRDEYEWSCCSRSAHKTCPHIINDQLITWVRSSPPLRGAAAASRSGAVGTSDMGVHPLNHEPTAMVPRLMSRLNILRRRRRRRWSVGKATDWVGCGSANHQQSTQLNC